MKKQILSGLLALCAMSMQAQWNLTGNTGTNAATNYMGTNDNTDVVFRRWGGRAGLLNPNNTSFGAGALNQAQTGTYNTAIGVVTLGSNTTGIFNTGVGFNALLFNTTGNHNVASGASALFNNISGGANIATGNNALFNNTIGNNNVATGHEALTSNVSGNHNLGYGYAAGGDLVSGYYNTFIGSNTGRGITTGFSNTIIGSNVTGLPPTLNNTVIIADGNGNQRIYVDNTGKVRIGIATLPTPGAYKLYVEDGILTEKLKVAVKTTSDWSDYVFADDYQLKKLEEVQSFIKANKHLPGVPSAEEMVKQGLDVAQTNAKLLEKIEELTLYILQLNERTKKLEQEKDASKNGRN